MKLVMTLLVRNEADILATNLEYHLQRGVDFFIAMDNLSEDGTRDILENYRRRKLLHLLVQDDDDYAQSTWVTKMARMAATEYQADWVINNDADEFWWPEETKSIADLLATVSPEVHTLAVPRHNFVPVPNDDGVDFKEIMTVREVDSRNIFGTPLLPKACHRGYPDVDVSMGNHGVQRTTGPMNIGRVPMSILHFPLRNYEQFRRKIVLGGAALQRNTRLAPNVVRSWRNLYRRYQQGELEGYYRDQEFAGAKLNSALASGQLVRDERLRDFMRRARTEK